MKKVFSPFFATTVWVVVAASAGLRAQSASLLLPSADKDYDKKRQNRARRIVAAAAAIVAAMMFASSMAHAEEFTEADRLVAEKFHILFSNIADDYPCKTSQAVRAMATLDMETNQVIKDIAYDEYSTWDVVEKAKVRHTVSGKEAEVNSLHKIYDRLRDSFWRLDALRPCNISTAVGYSGFQLGLYITKTVGGNVIQERFIANDQVTNSFDETHDPIGAGVSLAYGFTPWNDSVVVAPFVSIDYPNISVFHTFPGGSYLGTTSNVEGTLGVKIGPTFNSGIWLYGIAGVSALNETMKINFIPAYSSSDTTVAGGTVGAGIAWHPNGWQIANHPISLFAEYQHTWWQDAHFNTPTASPAFNYTFRREDDVVKFGVDISLGDPASPPPPTSTFPVKAARLK